MQAVILAAGKGTRLGKLTRKRSKAMLPVLGVPILQRVLDILIVPDVDELIVVHDPADIPLRNYFEYAARSTTKVRMVEQSEARGTADALRCVAPILRGDFVLTACDSIFIQSDLHRMFHHWRESQSLNGLLAIQNAVDEQMVSSAAVTLSGATVTSIVEKPGSLAALPQIASVFLYVFSLKLLDYLDDVTLSARGEYEIQDVIQRFIEEQGGVEGIFIAKRLTLSTPMDLLTINKHYLQLSTELNTQEPHGSITTSHLVPPVYIEEGAVIGRDCAIGPYVFVERDSCIGEGSAISEAVILSGTRLPPGSVVHHQVLCE